MSSKPKQGRRPTYIGSLLRKVEARIRRLQCLGLVQRELADEGIGGEHGPSLKTLRGIHRAMDPEVELIDKGGARPTYTKAQKREMASLAKKYGVTGDFGAIAILAAQWPDRLSRLRNKKIFPRAIDVSQPTITQAAIDFDKEIRWGRKSNSVMAKIVEATIRTLG